MIIAIDTETQGLDATKFIMGCIVHENLKSEVFYTAADLRTRVFELGGKCASRNKRLTVYAHNLQYDYIACGFHTDPHMHEYSTRPFLVNYEIDGRNPIKMIDTMGLWRGSLASLGEEIGCPKTPTPEWLTKSEYSPNPLEMTEAAQYMVQDASILIKYVQILKKMCKEENIWSPLLFTIPQISYQYFITYLRKLEGDGDKQWDPELRRQVARGKWLADIRRGVLHRPKNRALIERSVRGGRVECFQTGRFPSVSSVDVNSLFPYSACEMRFPHLPSERSVSCTPDTIPLQSIGVATVLIKTFQHHIGVLPVRIRHQDQETTFYPCNSEYLYGTWTLNELNTAVSEGYRILHVSDCVVFDDGANPLKRFMQELYEKKRRSTGFRRTFFKLMMNGLIGKFAQKRPLVESKLVDVEEIPALRDKGWDVVALYGLQARMELEGPIDYKRSYCPIYNSLVTAYSRLHMYSLYNSIPKEALLYSDTDSVYWNSLYSPSTVFKYSDALGDVKKEHENEPALFWRRKAYMCGDAIKLNRVPKSAVDRASFENGQINYTEIIKLKEDRENAGKPRKQTVNLAFESGYPSRMLYVDLEDDFPDELFATIKWDLTKNYSASSTSSPDSS